MGGQFANMDEKKCHNNQQIKYNLTVQILSFSQSDSIGSYSVITTVHSFLSTARGIFWTAEMTYLVL